MVKKIFFTVLFFLFFSTPKALALDLSVIVTNETCTGNGSLAFLVSNEASGVPVFYSVYLLPNSTTPIFTTTSSSYGGLVSGNYLVKASQTVGTTTTTSQQNVVIANQIVNLTFTVSSQSVKCGNDGQITVTTTNGIPDKYQLLSGPVTTGIQSSNVFSNLPAGQYNIRVFDICGEGVVQTFILLSLTPSLNIGPAYIFSIGNPICNFINTLHILTPSVNTQIFYPLTVQITAYPPSGGSPIITTITVNNSAMTLSIPSLNGVTYLYDLLITDVCGNQYIRNNNSVTKILDFGIENYLENCNDYYVEFILTNSVAPFTVNFVSAPAGFNPVLANPNHPGPFSGSSVAYGSAAYYMPIGNYVVQVTDACGSTKTKSFVVQEIPSNPFPVITSASCGSGANLSIGLNLPRPLATVILTSAPSSYPNSLPENLSSLIIGGVFYFQSIPLGTYSFSLTDVCGNPYTYTVLVSVPSEVPNVSQRTGCSVGDGSIQIKYALNPPNPLTTIVSIEIIQAPTTFANTLPYNVSFNIASAGFFSMNSLPEGNYKFKILNSCGIESTLDVLVAGFTISNSVYNVTENCGSFNLQLNHTSNGNYISSYHLQKYDAVNNVWEHPATGFDYTPGTFLTNINSFTLTNNSNNLNLAFTGEFRVVKSFYNFSNGTDQNNRCVVSLYEFEFSGGPKIVDAFAFPCANSTQEVVIVATGLPPLNYKITAKDGLPFVINNNNSNVFTGLVPASYNFEVTDVCGNVVNRVFDVSLLEPPTVTATDLCNGQNGQLELQNFPFVTYQWYNVQNPTVILSTTNTLQFSPFNSATNIGTYEVHLSTTNTNSCINQTIPYTISSSGLNPNAGNNANPSFCKESQNLNLNSLLSSPHDSNGVWTDSSANVVTNPIINPIDFNAGTYQYTYTVNGLCATSDAAIITITVKDLPAKPTLTAPTPICQDDNVLLNANTISNATYFWTGPNGFTSSAQNPLIQNFTSTNDGTYFAFVTVNGCNSPTEQIILNSNPLPDFTIDGVTSICTGQNENLTINPVNFDVNLVAIEWYFENILLSTQTSSVLQINQIGNYKAIINSNGCLSQYEVEVIEKINSFDVVLEQGCNGNQYEIHIINSSNFPNASYSWTGPNNFVSSSQNIVVPNLAIGDYNVEVTDNLGCKSYKIAVVENTNCFIPNGFSPDDDGYNDSFDLSGYNVKKIYVYNRWGKLVYDKDNYLNEWKGQTNNNEKLPASTYFYVLEFNEGENKTGWVYVTY